MSRRQKDLQNIMAYDNLEPEAKDFIESLKIYEYDIWDYHYSEKIRLVNQDKDIKKLIRENNIELGNTESFGLSKLDMNNQVLADFARLGYQRESIREFDAKGISFEELSQLLQVVYFNKNNVDLPENINIENQPQRIYKNIASGGGMYPVELYYISLNTNGIPKGTYHYNLKNKSLDLLHKFSEDDVQEIRKAYMVDIRNVIDFENAGGIIVLGGMVHRGSFKYGNRSVIFNYIDSGAIINNIYLLTGELNMGCCAIGGYIDDTLKKYLGLTTNTQIITGSIFIGSKTQTRL